MSKINARELLKKYAEGNCSPEEMAMVETYYNQFKPTSVNDLPEQELGHHLHSIGSRLRVNRNRRNFKLWYSVSAAVILIAFSIGLYFYIYSKSYSALTASRAVAMADVPPGTQKAMLILADGRKIALDDFAKGDVASQAGIRIVKTEDGSLLYSGNDITTSAQLFNRIETPKGGEFQINLPDGTRVWLNAASSLKYPVSFKGEERKVVLTGEAYFEVAQNKSKPFKVLTSKQEVEVLGTHFNINAYEDTEGTRTTLIEGSVKVKQLDHKNVRQLKPGQLAILHGNSLAVKEADIESEMAWKNGYFIFNGENLESIMYKISRWYDIEVIYSSGLINKEVRFGGIVSRSKNISVVLKTMERTGQVHFKLEGKRVTVLP